MLQQILTDMFIEPELLAELNEDQKQILFFKMREEQVRRWKEREARLEKETAVTPRPGTDTGKRISWLLGSDSDVWVWVMGEHSTDQPYEQICDDIMAERAMLQAQKEAEELRAKKEEELVKRLSNIHLDGELKCKQEEEQGKDEEEEKKEKEEEEVRQAQARQAAAEEQSRREEELKRREEEERRKAEEEVRRLEEERAQQIYMDLKEVQHCVLGQEREDPEWQESLRKSKAADLRRRSLAKQTREDHRRRSVRALEQGRVAAMTKTYGGPKPALPPKPKQRTVAVSADPLSRKPGVRRTQSTSSREQIVRWFKEEQLPQRAGFLKDQSRIAPWFHGIIARQDAEALLSPCAPGYFLVRVSERIKGYVLSYRCQEEVKHFLIDATENCCTLLGDQIKFPALVDLVEYYEGEPITMSGGEQLSKPCGQKQGQADYADLFT
ncbi:SH2 domain-containing protein 4A [Conger conger]|uniref:SH2 domain-containing protein 4A n=1 Tax=Conger conger TaxID=82655 RepID=UPI002A5A8E4C|nr:SH2 domain-containing protein 4A [Conger conger]XP_061119692.1 SH2 domain-containing protein 4A [Conger conger]XP_061119693.1 SH2 domain-containing protein 4A [Conger conger]XP_061119694.1 SH2 domain-containing protein 4A [Conger conger]XP_061119695.1 SH2 domain-containing protein 4A [Conger conger]